MYDPKFRFALLVSMLVLGGSTAQVLFTYVFGNEGLNLRHYFSGVVEVSSSTIGGYLFIWLCIKIITLSQYRKTGFEATYVDETGTEFNFPVSLSKYLPEIVAPPLNTSLHPLESELIGFINGYHIWPYNLKSGNETLFKRATSQWKAMSALKGTNHLHRIAALAQDLGVVYAYEEKRKKFPFIEFWKRDKVGFAQRCDLHGGLSAFILSTFPAFRDLHPDKETSERQCRALLTAIRYRNDPIHMPMNCDPLAREIYEFLHVAEYHAEQANKAERSSFSPDENDIMAFDRELFSYFQAAVRELEINPASFSAESSDGVYTGNGLAIVRMSRLTKRYAKLLSPPLRNTFNLWQPSDSEHASWPYFIKALRQHDLLHESWEDVNAGEDGMFNLRINGVTLPRCVILNISNENYPELRKYLDSQPRWTGLVELQQNPEELLEDVQIKVAAVDEMIKGLGKVPTA